MSRCEQVRLELEAHLRGRLDPDVDAHVRAHLSGCQACSRAAARLAPLVDALEETRRASEQAFDPQALASRVLARSRAADPAPPRRGPGSGAALLGAGFVLLGATALVLLRASTTRPAPPPGPTAPPTRALPAPPRDATPPPGAPHAPAPPDEPAPPEQPAQPEQPALPQPQPAAPQPAATDPPLEAPVPDAPSPGSGESVPEEEPPVVAQGPDPASPPVAPPPPDAPVAPAAARLACRVSRARGAGQISQGAGDEAARPGDPLPPGATLSVERGALELTLVAAADELERGLTAGSRLVLPRGARVRLEPAGLRLLAGECWIEAAGALSLQAGQAEVRLQDADLHLRAGRRDLQAQVWAGRARLLVAAAEVELVAAQEVALDPQGRGAPRRARGSPPAWRAPGPDPARVLFHEPCRGLVARAWGGLVGAPGPEAIEAAARAELGGVRVACLGKGGGLARFVPGARARFSYRVAEAVPLAFSVTDLRRQRNLTATLAAPRVGVWTTVELDLERLAHASGAALEPGDPLDFLAAQAGTPGHTAALELRELSLER